MIRNQPLPAPDVPDDYAAWLAMCDEALAAGTSESDTPAPESGSSDCDDAFARARDLACLRVVRELLQPRSTQVRPLDPTSAHRALSCDSAAALKSQISNLKSEIVGVAASTHPMTTTTSLSQLGDFRIVREIGRGGMGVVYEAVQLSLGRRVALKILPFACGLDATKLQRFKNEAQAAATLHHTNIVPVFAVGSEHGVYYYAMQFIEGQSLAERIEELRRTGSRDSCKCVAELGVQAAEALEHAHQLGVIHRDIKPANLLVERSLRNSTAAPAVAGEGLRLWVADFGLARLHDESDLTMTGDLVGTMRYMSPEQAMAKRVPIDHRTDVYSLGITLYELLTLEPAFDGDRQALMRKIAFEDPRPPRRINKSVPADLETIVLKATTKNPAERYATSQDLADDLRRFLEDRPILARRPTLVQIARKFARRHKAVVTTAAFGAIVAVLIAIGLLVERNARISAEQRETAAAKNRAVAAYKEARKAVDTMYTDVAEKLFKNQPHMEPKQREFLEKALAFYDGFATDLGDDPETRLEAAQARRRVADIQSRLGQPVQAEQSYKLAIETLVKLVGEVPHEPSYRAALGDCYQGLCHTVTYLLYRGADGAAAGLKAVQLREQLAAEFPHEPRYQSALIQSLLYLAGPHVTLPEHRKEFENSFVRAVRMAERLAAEFPAEPEYRERQATGHASLGILHQQAERFRESIESFERGIAMYAELAAEFPTVPAYHEDHAESIFGMAQSLAACDRFADAAAAYREAAATAKKLSVTFPNVPTYRWTRARSHVYLARTLAAYDQLDEAEQELQQAFTLYEASPNGSETAHIERAGLMDYYFEQGRLLQYRKRADEAVQAFENVVAIAGETPVPSAGAFNYVKTVLATHQALSDLHAAAGRRDYAALAQRAADDTIEMNSAQFAATPDGRHELATLNMNQASWLSRPETGQAALDAYSRAIDLWEKLAAEFPAQFVYRRNLATAQLTLGDFLRRQPDRRNDAEPILRHAAMIADKLALEFPNAPRVQSQSAICWMHLASMLVELGRAAEAERLCRRALEVATSVLAATPHASQKPDAQAREESNPTEPSVVCSSGLCSHESHLKTDRAALAEIKLVLASALHATDRADEAATLFREASEICERLAIEEPRNDQRRALLANSRRKMIELLIPTVWSERAETDFAHVLRLLEQSVAENPTALGERLELATRHEQLGHLRRDAGRFATAAESFAESAHRFADVIAASPNDPTHRRRRGSNQFLAGVSLAEAGQLTEAETALGRATEQFAALVQDVPDTAHWQDLARAQLWRAMVVARDTARGTDSIGVLRDAIAFGDRTEVDATSSAATVNELATAHYDLGRLLADANQPHAAEQAYRRLIKLRALHVRNFGDNPAIRNAIADAHGTLGHLLRTYGRPSDAVPEFRSFAAAKRKLADESAGTPVELDHLRAMTTGLLFAAVSQTDAGEVADAETAYDELLKTHDELAARHGDAPQLRSGAAATHSYLARLFKVTNRPEQAWHSLRRAIELFERLTTDHPDDHDCRHWLADLFELQGWWHLFERRVDDAITSFRRSVESWDRCAATVTPVPSRYRYGQFASRRALGIAIYRSSDWAAASAMLDESLKFTDSGDPLACLYLAMARHQLGDTDQARNRYQQALRLIKDSNQSDAELRRVLDEATSLLGSP